MEPLVGIIGPTALQVGVTLAASVYWGIMNPCSGAHFPETLPTDFIISTTKPWLGRWVSERNDWTPLSSEKPVELPQEEEDSEAGLYAVASREPSKQSVINFEQSETDNGEEEVDEDDEGEEDSDSEVSSTAAVLTSSPNKAVRGTSNRSRSMSFSSETQSEEETSRSVSPSPSRVVLQNEDHVWQFLNFLAQPPAYATI